MESLHQQPCTALHCTQATVARTWVGGQQAPVDVGAVAQVGVVRLLHSAIRCTSDGDSSQNCLNRARRSLMLQCRRR